MCFVLAALTIFIRDYQFVISKSTAQTPTSGGLWTATRVAKQSYTRIFGGSHARPILCDASKWRRCTTTWYYRGIAYRLGLLDL